MMAYGLQGTNRRAAMELLLFFVCAFGITWMILGAYLFAPKPMSATLGPMKTGSAVFFLAVYAPSLSAIVLTLILGGLSGLRNLGASAIRIAGRWWWVAFSLVGYPLFWLVVTIIQTAISGKSLGAVPYSNWYAALPAVIASGFIFRDAGPLGEEFGWRGYALPRLLAVMNARWAALVLGAIWAVWHLPAFFLSGLSQSKFQFGTFVFVVIGFSILMTLLFIHTRGSVLLAGIIPHMWFNAVSKAGIHPVDWLTIATAAAVLVFGGRIWRSSDAS